MQLKTATGQTIDINNDGDLHKLKTLLTGLPYSGPDSPQRGKAFQSLESDIKRAIGKKENTPDLIQKVWTMIVNTRDATSLVSASLPSLSQAKQAKAPVIQQRLVPSINIHPGFLQDAQNCRPKFIKLCPDLSQIDWILVTENIWRLSQAVAEGGAFYLKFFPMCENLLDRIDQLTGMTTKLRLLDVFKKRLASPYINDKSIGNYKGGAAEVLDALSVVLCQAGPPNKVTIPKHNKAIDAQFVLQGGLAEQDIDRTAIYGNTKYYIEVKADCHTAVKKHVFNSDQMQRMKAVVQSRANKQSKTFGILNRVCAVSILNPDDWLELFTEGTAFIYHLNAFHLFIDGVIFTPDAIKQIHDQVWSQATGENAPPATYNERSRCLDRLELFFNLNKAAFPGPRQIAGTLQVPTLNCESAKTRMIKLKVIGSDPTDSVALDYELRVPRKAWSTRGKTSANGTAAFKWIDPSETEIYFPGLSPAWTKLHNGDTCALTGARYVYQTNWA